MLGDLVRKHDGFDVYGSVFPAVGVQKNARKYASTF